MIRTFGKALAFVIVAGTAQAEEIGDAERGEKVFHTCTSCHQIGFGAENRVGPHLNGIFGRKAGAFAEDYRYSKGLLREGENGLVWDLRTLNAYIENPKALVTGTRMNFPGVKEPEKRADLLAYLRTFSDSPQNIPEAQPTGVPREVELSPEILAIVGDPEYGEYLASECTTCHQSSGSDEGIPSITHWPEEDFVVAMHAYKRKIRPHPVMQMMTSRLTDEEIAALAAYFKSIE
ncbi:c-type cytochrome [Lentibacter sp. XHP0401]|nr:c-type cytochrome [Lentibacter sp. XHP0401]MCV2893910.1 c-type cytochrome [Lentibacter sp. XHP0401]